MDNFWVGLVLGVILGLIVGWLMGRRSSAAGDSGLQAELQTTQAEVSRLRSELSAAERDTVNWRTKYDEQVAASSMRSADMPEVAVDRPALQPVDDVTVDMPDVSANMPAIGGAEVADAPFDAIDTVVSGRSAFAADMPPMGGPVRAYEDRDEAEGDVAEPDMVEEAERIAGRFAPAEMPPPEVEPIEALPDITASFLDDLPEGAVVVHCPQDLSAVRGIGQQYEQKLYRRGVGTYWMLAELSDETLGDILGVQAFQDVDMDAIRASAREWAEKTGAVGRVWDATEPDDFEVLDGIGDVYEGRLYDAGICTYEALAALTEAELAEICRAPSFRQPDYAGWIATAQRLAAQERA